MYVLVYSLYGSIILVQGISWAEVGPTIILESFFLDANELQSVINGVILGDSWVTALGIANSLGLIEW